MKVTQVEVSAGRTFNHPYESFSNYRPSVTLTATLSEEEDVTDATRKLQAMAEFLAEEQKQQQLKTCIEEFNKKYNDTPREE